MPFITYLFVCLFQFPCMGGTSPAVLNRCGAISILFLYMTLKKSHSIALNFYEISRELFMYDFKEIYVYTQTFVGFLFLKQWCVLSNTFMHRMGRVHLFIC